MQYMIIMGILVAVAVLLSVVIIVTLVKSRKDQDDYDYEDDYDDDDYDEDDYDDEYDEEDMPPHRRSRQRGGQDTRSVPQGRPTPESQRRPAPEPQRRPAPESQRRTPVKKQWKIILENLDTWEKFTFIFYDNIGIGRSKGNQEFEKYLSVQDDPRISKLHCAIIRKDDMLYLEDMDSRNGTYLNGKRIRQPIVIQKDDVIGLGSTKIEIKKVLRERD